MFFSDDLLTNKKGALGIVWLMGTLGPRSKRITRKALTGVEIVQTCELIAEPPEPLALRLSGHLLVGVARVYNQNYEIFHNDVQDFDARLRRSIVTDFSATVGGGGQGVGRTGDIDLPGGGRSRIEQITFGGNNLTWMLPLDPNTDFVFTDWARPSNQRASTPKLGSLTSQSHTTDFSERDEEEEDEERDVDEPEHIRARAREKSNTGTPKPGTPQSDIWKDLAPAPDFTPVDLHLIDTGPVDPGVDDSFSGPSGNRPFTFEDPPMEEDVFQMTPVTQITLPEEHLGSEDEADRVLGGHGQNPGGKAQQPPTKKTKKGKVVRFDSAVETSSQDDYLRHTAYLAQMDDLRRQRGKKQEEAAFEAQANALVNGAGQWIIFDDAEMNEKFEVVSKPGQFKWEMEVAAFREKRPFHLVDDEEEEEQRGEDVNRLNSNDEQDTTYAEQHQDFIIPIPLIDEVDAPEVARRASQSSQLPWDDMAPFDFPQGADMSFTPQGSTGFTPNMRRDSEPRHRSSSIISGDQDALMLGGSQDVTQLPPDDYDMSQSQKDSQIPPSQTVYAHAMLATLEKQCRDFYSFVEKRMDEVEAYQLNFEDLVTVKRGQPGRRRVAMFAFYNCLTLATRQILAVEQKQAWGDITVRIAPA